MLELYHAGLTQASVKVRTTLKEKELTYKSHYLRLPEGEHLTAEFLAINPDGQVPALVHDGEIITETSVINEYLDDAFPDPPLRPASPIERARMRHWSQIVDEHLFHALATLGWAFGIGPILRERGQAEFEKSFARLAIHSSGRNGPRPITAFRKRTSTRRAPRSATASRERSGCLRSILIWRDRPIRSQTSTCCLRSSGYRAGLPT
jgi:glutathione S-transferase